jgi:DNA-binding MarR family transcriptional regulator
LVVASRTPLRPIRFILLSTLPTDQSIDLLFALNQASFALASEMNAALAALEITIRDYCVLWKARDGTLTQRQIADAALLDKTTMVNTVDGLEEAGLARRKPSITDRRARLLVLTPHGRKVVSRGQAIIDRLAAEILSAIPEQERAPFVSALQGLVDGRLSSPSHIHADVTRQTAKHSRSR